MRLERHAQSCASPASRTRVYIRPAQQSDGPLMAGLSAPFVAQDLLVGRSPASLSGSIDDFLVAVSDFTVVGCVGIADCRRELLVYNLCVAAPAQGRGIGRLLIEHAVAVGTAGRYRALLAASKYAGSWFLRLDFRPVELRGAPAEWLACLDPDRDSHLYLRDLPAPRECWQDPDVTALADVDPVTAASSSG